MALSDYEKQVLEQMEAELRRADPDLASAMSKAPKGGSGGSGKLEPRRIAAGSVLALAGLGVVLGGVTMGYSVWSILLGILGFVMMVGGILLALRTDKGNGGNVRTSGSGKPGSGPKKRRGWSGFMSDQERRWDRRSD